MIMTCIEAPLKYMIMLYDSSCWATMSLRDPTASPTIDDDQGGEDGTLMEPFLGHQGLDELTMGNSLAQGVFDSSGWGSPSSQHRRREEGAQSSTSVPAIHFARLEILEVIGAGATANVYSARLGNRPMAAKRFYCEDIRWRELKTICHEMLVTWHLQPNPHVVEFKGYCVEPPFIYTVMELCDAGSLHDLLHPANPAGNPDIRLESSLEERLGWALDCVEAVAFLHLNFFYHRDVKSPNFIAKQGGDAGVAGTGGGGRGLQIKLCDFGASVKSQTQPGSVARVSGDDLRSVDSNADTGAVGTLEWMAPEIVAARDHLCAFTAHSDVYSTAVVVWECITCQDPFIQQGGRRMPQAELAALIRSGGRPDCSNVRSERMRGTIEKAWEQDPKERATLGDLRAGLMREFDRERGAVV